MPEMQVTLAELVRLLQERQTYLYARNLVLVALPVEAAHRLAPQLAQALDADYLDFDRELLQSIAQDDWEEHVTLAKKGTLTIGKALAQRWLRQVTTRFNRQRALVIGNVNLALFYQLDVAQALYDATQNGLCILAGGGRLQGQVLLLHGTFPQTGAGSQAYELVFPAQPPAPAQDERSIQERLF